MSKLLDIKRMRDEYGVPLHLGLKLYNAGFTMREVESITKARAGGSDRRFEAAKAAMQGLAAHGANDLDGAALVAVDAVHLADALLAALNDGNESS